MIYQNYATVYDGSGQVRFALLSAQYLAQLLRRHPVNGRRMLDLACGTGTLALLMASEGWQVVGVDASEAMLAQARARARHAIIADAVTFIHGDMRQIAPLIAPQSFDLVSCMFDSLNYMVSEDDLAACFRSVAYALAPGGLFVGDMNTRHFLEHDWGNCEVHEQPGYTQISQSRFDPAASISTMHLTGFIGDDQRGYARFDEVHVERSYPVATVARLINTAGLQVEATYTCFSWNPPADTTQRIAWVVRRTSRNNS